MKNEKKYAEKLKEEYSIAPKEKTQYEKLRELDGKVKKPVNIFSYVYGTVGSLVLGTGMCVAMGVVGGLMPVGIIVGLAGIGMMASTYPLHKKILKFRKQKYADEILKLSNEVIEVSDYQQTKQADKSQITANDVNRNNYSLSRKDNYFER